MTPPDLRATLRHQMQTHFGIPPERVNLVWSPYRICPLGAHIDHQLGTVTAMAIDQGALLAFAPADRPEVRLRSAAYPGEVRLALDRPPGPRVGDWGDYARGAVQALGRVQKLKRGLVGITSGEWAEIGLSSSASIGVAYLLALEHVNGLRISAVANIRLDQAIENEYLGLNNGILDQTAILLSRRHQLTVIDCQAFAEPADNDPTGEPPRGISWIAQNAAMAPYLILVAVSGLTQAVLATGYNQRVSECRDAARLLLAAAGRATVPSVLGNVTPAEYAAHQGCLPAAPGRRARHFFFEMQRVRDGMAAWGQGDLTRFGQLMTASGQSSIEAYECGSPPLIDLYRILVRTPGIYGARFSGAGFRGCCVALADPGQVRSALPDIQRAYAGRQPALAARARMILCQSGDGACIV